MAGANTLTFTDAGWDKEVLNSEVPVLVDFWAEWCGPCRMMTPTIDAIADDYAGRVKVGKLNVDENGGTGMRYRVQSIPTLLLFKGGQIVEHKVGVAGTPGFFVNGIFLNGAQPQAEFEKIIDNQLALLGVRNSAP